MTTNGNVTSEVSPELIVDQRPMVLDGFNISIARSGLGWTLTGIDLPGTAETRVPSNGKPPFIFFSTNPSVASVDYNTGTVRSEGNGKATIHVTDQRNQTKSYPVNVSNVTTYLFNPSFISHSDYLTWASSVKASPILTLPELNLHLAALNTKFIPTSYTSIRTTAIPSPAYPGYHVAIGSTQTTPQFQTLPLPDYSGPAMWPNIACYK